MKKIDGGTDSCPDYHGNWAKPRVPSHDIHDQSGQSTKSSDIENLEGSDFFSYFDIYQSSERDDFADFRQELFFDEETVRQYGHRKSDFIAQCSFDNQNCLLTDFMEFEDPTYGKCFTFNSDKLVVENFKTFVHLFAFFLEIFSLDRKIKAPYHADTMEQLL